MGRRITTVPLGLAVVALTFASTGCRSTGSVSKMEPTGGKTAMTSGSEFREAPLGAEKVRETTASMKLEPVYFDLDRFDIRAKAVSTLRANARAIKSNAGGGGMIIEGHCDERGSDEYNLALGERRAKVVKRFLVDLGVPASQLSTVSYGETMPATAGHDELAWRLNRRSEFRASGSAALRPVSSR